jgi:hypothetical protein
MQFDQAEDFYQEAFRGVSLGQGERVERRPKCNTTAVTVSVAPIPCANRLGGPGTFLAENGTRGVHPGDELAERAVQTWPSSGSSLRACATCRSSPSTRPADRLVGVGRRRVSTSRASRGGARFRSENWV